MKSKQRLLHKTIQKVTDDLEGMRFNTGISSMMEFVNGAQKWDDLPKEVMEPFVMLLSPFAPHIAEELWEMLGHTESLAYEPWPEFNEEHLIESTIEIPVQVNGKLRGKIQMAADADKDTVLLAAKEAVQKQLEGKTIRKEIYIPGKMVNLVVG